MAKSQSVSKSTINNIWQTHNLEPHRVEAFKLSRDPTFLQKMTEVDGPYLNPPEQPLVLCVDEKGRFQALNRTPPGLPLKQGRCGTMTQDYKCNDATTLFASQEILQRNVIGQCYRRHRHQGFLKLLRTLDKEFPDEVPLHLVMESCGTQQQELLRNWLNRHPRFVLHFVPTRSSWLNLVERWFEHLDGNALRRGVFRSVGDLKAAIDSFLIAWNQDPQPFGWTATVQSITDKLSRCRQTLEMIQPGCTNPPVRKRQK